MYQEKCKSPRPEVRYKKYEKFPDILYLTPESCLSYLSVPDIRHSGLTVGVEIPLEDQDDLDVGDGGHSARHQELEEEGAETEQLPAGS